ncbi:MAG: hypothetical protein HQK77_19240 [Desulfobacterales bacterium]|nr:hypothetical protein [Desulfobacterales bacterium]
MTEDKINETIRGADTYSKRCPYCFVYLSLDAKVCYSCNHKVRNPNKYGIAKKPFDWYGFIAAIVTWAAFGYYLWWWSIQMK